MSVAAEGNNKKLIYNKISFRTIFIVLTLLLEIAGIIALTLFANVNNIIWLNIVYFIAEIISILCAIPIINSRMDPSYKITWLTFMVINSVMGALFYLLFANKKFTKREKAKIAPSLKSLNEALDSDTSNGISRKLDPIKDGDLYNFSNYIRRYSFTDTYQNTNSTYFAWGDDAFPVMLEKLKSAKHYIFLEYFIIQPGLFWNSILEILLKKAKEGLDIRVIYDSLGCISTLPDDYYLYLRNNGVKCFPYSPLTPLMNIRMNNRDHRKILVIDGHTGFTGGINLADEYINEVIRFGKWKDNAIMLEGDGVFGLTNLFLSTWNLVSGGKENVKWNDYLPVKYASEVPPVNGNGYVAPYGSIPFTYETVGLSIYEMLCYRAKSYIDIATPYLILNKEMQNAICQAAKNGVRVRLLTPHVPDKKTVFELTRANYRMLLRSGVEIYEYTPGFVHSKMFVVDGVMATVGTINLDYRSLFLHSENGCFLYKVDAIKDIEKDFENTFRISERFTLKDLDEAKFSKKLFRLILQIFAPLM